MLGVWWGGWEDRGCEHLLCGCFSELDLPDWVLQCGVVWAWPSWVPILADRELSELNLALGWVLVDVDVGDTHLGGGNVWIWWDWYRHSRSVVGVATRQDILCSSGIVCCLLLDKISYVRVVYITCD